MGEYLVVDSSQDGKVIRCRKCGYAFCSPDQQFKEFAAMAEYPLTRAHPRNSRTDRFLLREFCCPGCWTLLEVELALRGAPLVRSFVLSV